MNKELEEAIKRLSKDKNKPLACGDITIVNIEDLDIVLDYVEILETATNNKYPYVVGGRTLYSRLQQLDKEDLIKAYLRLRNETEQLIKENKNSIPSET